MFGQSRCGVAVVRERRGRCSCARLTTNVGRCTAGPADEQFRTATGRVAERAGSEMVDAFDLSALAVQPRLEVGLLVDSGAASLLDRPLDLWLGAIRARG